MEAQYFGLSTLSTLHFLAEDGQLPEEMHLLDMFFSPCGPFGDLNLPLRLFAGTGQPERRTGRRHVDVPAGFPTALSAGPKLISLKAWAARGCDQ